MTAGNYWMASQFVAAATSLVVLILVWRYCTAQFGVLIGLAIGWLPGTILGLFVGALTLLFWGAIASFAVAATAIWCLLAGIRRLSLICRQTGGAATASRLEENAGVRTTSTGYRMKRSLVGRVSNPTRNTEPSKVSR